MAERRHIHSRLAFTLIEMVLVIATIALLSAIAIPRYAQAMNRYRVDLAAKRVVADFTLARSTARATGAGQVVNFATPVNGYTLPGVKSPDGRSGDYIVKLSDEPYKTSITAVGFGPTEATSIRFTRYGAPEANGVVIVSAGGFQKTILLDGVTGRAEVQ